MKIKKTVLFLCLISLISCSSDDVEPQHADELNDLELITTFSNQTHHIELYSTTGKLQTGFNQINLRILDVASDEFLPDASISWLPIMHMANMQHAAPASMVEKVPGTEALYSGYLIFSMPDNSEEKWEIDFSYQIEGAAFTAAIPIEVSQEQDRTVVSFTGEDNENYLLALVQPFEARVAVNDIQMVLYKMESMMDYLPVEGFKILIDPRMPGMGNHGSPNNVNLVQGEDEFYAGKLSFTMSGLWRINLQVLDSSEQVIKGEAVTQDTPDSSIYMQLEF